ncbi:MAG: YbjN domain-containing protein [Alphaproteobacteria bacterium]|nr:YbjN domain-containing protein [Alphaproteobacteria bacterium]
MDIQSDSEFYDDLPNPLDSVEEILSGNNWTYDRMDSDQLVVRVAGKSCAYRLFFIWQENMGALQYCCQYELELSKDNLAISSAVLMDINTALWLGHFEISRENFTPSFRQTCLFKGADANAHSEKIEDLVDISLAQCERYYPVFHILSQEDGALAEHLSLALMDTAGRS